MASFEIADCITRLPIVEAQGADHVQRGTLTITLRNLTDRRRGARVTVETTEGAKPAWFAFKDAPATSQREIERDFEARASITVKVDVTIPAGEPPANHVFRLRVTDEDDPDNDFVVGPNVAFSIAPWTTAPPPRAAFPWWAVAVAAGLVLVVGGATGYLLLRPTGPVVPEVIGTSWVQAKRALDQAGINHGTAPRDHTRVVIAQDMDLGAYVLAVDPNEGARIPEGGKLDVYIHAGRDPYYCRACDNRRLEDLPPTIRRRVEEGIALARARLERFIIEPPSR
jgi:hypothetical protein